VKLE
jgi:hypothetical protein